MTEGGKRRDGILSLLEESDTPLSGTELAHRFKGKPPGDRSGYCSFAGRR